MTQELFQSIKQTFFPLWDRKGEWKFEEVDHLDGYDGTCCPEDKTIRVCNDRESDVEIKATIVHEICHGVSGGCHSDSFFARMERAVLRADQIGNPELAAVLRADIKFQKDCLTAMVSMVEADPAGAAAELYNNLERCVDRYPDRTAIRVLSTVAHAVGLDDDMVLKLFPLAWVVIRAAQREIKEERKAREKFEAALRSQKGS